MLIKNGVSVPSSNVLGKRTSKDCLLCPGKDHFDGVILTSQDHVHLISREDFSTCTKFQDQTPIVSALLEIACYVIVKVIFMA